MKGGPTQVKKKKDISATRYKAGKILITVIKDKTRQTKINVKEKKVKH